MSEKRLSAKNFLRYPVLIVSVSIFIFFTYGSTAMASSGRTIYAAPPPVGSVQFGNGTIAWPYASITKAMSVAVSGDTIAALDGAFSHWNETYPINFVSGVRLQGAGASNNSINGDPTGSAGIFSAVNVSASTVIDGFTITGGNGAAGSGIYVSNGQLTISNCSISGNHASGNGGGVYIGNNSAVVLTGNTIANNTSGSNGGGVYVDTSNPSISDNTISGNTATGAGGGIYTNYTAGTILNNIVSGNTAFEGGGIAASERSHPTITGNTISGNTGNYGGGLRLTGHVIFPTTAAISYNTITGNTGLWTGGGVYAWASANDVFTNNVISGNSGYGVDIYSASPTFMNCTIANNTLDGFYGRAPDPGAPTITNCIVYSNGGTDMFASYSATYSDIGTGNTAGTGNISLYPMLTNPSGSDYSLMRRSPAIDAGTNTGAPDDDINTTSRPRDGDNNTTAVTDMGAYEFTYAGGATLYVATDGHDNSGDGTQENPFKSVTYGLARALAGDTVVVGPGVYSTGNTGEVYPINLKTDVTINGAAATDTIVWGDGTHSVFNGFNVGAGTLNGVTITNGSNSMAGGIYFSSAGYYTVSNCVIKNNSTSDFVHGGAIYEYSSGVILINDTVVNNTGNGILGLSGTPTVTNCIMWGNSGSDLSGLAVSYCNFSGGSGSGNIGTYPMFADPDNGDFRLSARSPAIDAGTNTGAPAGDKNGNSRPRDGDSNGSSITDMGAYEFTYAGPVTLYVDDSGVDTQKNGTVDSPFRSITKGMALALSGDTVSVGSGTYSSGAGEVFPISLKSDVTLTGAGSPGAIISGDGAHSIISAVSVNSGARLIGFTLTGGQAANGGAIYCELSSPVIADNVITDNDASSNGGAMYCLNATPAIKFNTIFDNGSGTGTGGIYCASSTPTIINCVVWNNGDDLFGCSATYSDIEDNDAGTGNIHSSPLFVNSGSGDFHLSPVSPCINAGTAAGFSYDKDNNVRPQGLGYDIGAYEHVDLTAPTGTILINSDAQYSTSSTVTLNLTAADTGGSGLAWMRFSNDGVFDTETWEANSLVNPTRTGWVLSANDGTKTVYAQFKDEAGNVSTGTISDTIVLDTTNPVDPNVVSSSHTRSVWSNDNTIDVSWSGATDTGGSGVAGVSYEWSQSDSTVPDTVQDAAGASGSTTSSARGNANNWYFHLRTKDNAGNWTSTVHFGPFYIDTIVPTGTISINSSAQYSNSATVTLNLTAADTGGSGLYQMRFSNDGVFDTETWEANTSGTPTRTGWTLSAGNGTKTVYAQFKDNAGNVSSATISDDILVDTALPTGTISINAGAICSTSPSVTLNLTAADTGGSNLAWMRFSNDNSSWSTWEANTSATPTKTGWDMTSATYGGIPGYGTKTVYVQYKDGAGNVSTGTISNSILYSSNPNPLDHIAMTPSAGISLSPDGTQSITSQGQDQYNAEIPGLTYGWTAAGGALDSLLGPTVTYTAGPTVGLYTITVTSGAKSSSANVMVTKGATDIGVYRTGSYPNWFFLRAKSDGTGFISPDTPGNTWSYSWGNPGGDTPITGDFNGDGKQDLAVYRYGSYPNWFVLLAKPDGSGFDPTNPAYCRPLSWGNPGGDTPMVGDFNGDGKSDLAVYRYGSYPNWFVYLSKGDGTGFAAPVLGVNYWEKSWGNPGGDTPLIGDFDGNGKSDIAVYRYGSYPNWFFLRANAGGTDFVPDNQVWSVSWGNPGGDTPLAGDFNGDGYDDIGVYRYGSYPNWFFLPANSGGTGFVSPADAWALTWGNPGGDKPIVGNFNGDVSATGHPVTDIGVYRTGSYPNWFFKVSTLGGDLRTGPEWSLTWGNAGGDTPMIGDFNGDAPHSP